MQKAKGFIKGNVVRCVLVLFAVFFLFIVIRYSASAETTVSLNSFTDGGLTFTYIPSGSLFSLFSVSPVSSSSVATNSGLIELTSTVLATQTPILVHQDPILTRTPTPSIESSPTQSVSPVAQNSSVPTDTPTPSPTQIPTPTVTPSPTQSSTVDANSDAIWDQLAACESNGNWNDNTGNGYYGGLQFSQGAWNSVDGTGLPSDASREDQIAKGKLLQQQRGWGAWGGCAKKLGLD